MKNLTQEKIANHAGMSLSYYGRIERGEVNMSIQSLIQIALTLDVEPSDLLPKLSLLKKIDNYEI